MAVSVVDGSECISCGACVAECPNKAISENSNGVSSIDPSVCDNCNGDPCCQKICPVDCIKTQN